MPLEYEVDGVMLARPFRIVNMSPLGLFMDDLGTALTFYTDVMGFKETERNTVLGEPAHYLRLNSEHHSLALYPASLKAKLGLQAQSTCAVLGFQVANYKQLRNAVAFLQAEGYSLFDAPPEFQTGTDYAAHFLDPDGHCIRLYHSMEQVNWNGDPRPQDQRSILPVNQWPDALRDSPSAYSANIFQGPLG
jgi:catechol 2,3-dioxygenase-like lactoylglutathione lyase family enzyme